MEDNKKSSQVAGTTSEEKSWIYFRIEVTNGKLLKLAEMILSDKNITREELLLLLNTYKVRNT